MTSMGEASSTTARITFDHASQAAFDGDGEVVQEWLIDGGEKDATNSRGVTLLMLASGRGHLRIVNELLHRDAHVNYQDATGYSALMYAANNFHAVQHPAVVIALLKCGAQLSLRDSCNQTALQMAERQSHTECVQLFRVHLESMVKSRNTLVAPTSNGEAIHDISEAVVGTRVEAETSGVVVEQSRVDEAVKALKAAMIDDELQSLEKAIFEHATAAEADPTRLGTSVLFEARLQADQLVVAQREAARKARKLQRRERQKQHKRMQNLLDATDTAEGTTPSAEDLVSDVETLSLSTIEVAAASGATMPIHSITPSDRESSEGCIICLAAPNTHVFVPCGHQCACEKCGEQVMRTSRQCPCCRGDAMMVMRVYVQGAS